MIKRIGIMATMLMASATFANDIYVEQVGSNTTANITQQGIGNQIGSSTTPAFIGGGSNLVNIDQIGSSNILAMLVNGAGTNTTVTTNGNSNTQSINCGTTGSASCSGSVITQIVSGDNNTITQNLGSGGNHTSKIDVTGDTNMVTHSSTANAATMSDIKVVGNTNTIGVTQSGITAQSVTVSSTGNSNNISIVQSN